MNTNGLKVGDKVTKGNGKKVLTIKHFHPQVEGSNNVFAALSSGTLWNVNLLKKAD